MDITQLTALYGNLQRLIPLNDILQPGDWISMDGGCSWEPARGMLGSRNFRNAARPVVHSHFSFQSTHNPTWIKWNDRFPTKDDCQKIVVIGPAIWYSAIWSTNALSDVTDPKYQDYYWMPLPPLPESCITITVEGLDHRVIFKDDGSINVGCTDVPKEKLEAIFERWSVKQKCA